MGIIEGIGDEVTILGVIILVIILAATVTFFLNGVPRNRIDTLEVTTDCNQQVPENQPSTHLEDSTNENAEIDSGQTTNTSTSHTEELPYAEKEKSSCVNTEKRNKEGNNSGDAADSRIYPDLPDSTVPSAPPEEETSSQTEEIPFERDQEINLEPGQIHIRLKYLDDTERTVIAHRTCQLLEFKRDHFTEDIANNRIVRLIFSGQLLQDQLTLQYYGVSDNCVVHVQILQAQIRQNTSSISQNGDLELSHLLWPLLSVILGICWILYFKYPDFFNMMSLGMLFLFTGSFAYFYCQVQHQ